jgi:sulfide:quinone oxidoreductase
MENLRRLSAALCVSPQIDEADVAKLGALGFSTIINNRPDGEGSGQSPSAALAEAAQRHGIVYRHIPIVPGNIRDEDAALFERAIEDSPGPVIAFCRTGTRSATLWALCEAKRRSPETVLQVAFQAGYDLSALRPRLERCAAEQ